MACGLHLGGLAFEREEIIEVWRRNVPPRFLGRHFEEKVGIEVCPAWWAGLHQVSMIKGSAGKTDRATALEAGVGQIGLPVPSGLIDSVWVSSV